MSGFRSSSVAYFRHMVGSVLLVATAIPTVSTMAAARPVLERQVLAALNDIRSAPDTHVEDMETYRRHLRGRIVTMPGTRITYRTLEGDRPVREAALFLSTVGSRQPLVPDPVLTAAAADHVAEQSSSGTTGHYGADGADPALRVVRRGGGAMVTEVIAYGALDAADVVRQFVIDDGVPGRGHRRAIFAGRLRYAGVACGPHPKYRTMCVIDMAATPGGEIESDRPLNIASSR